MHHELGTECLTQLRNTTQAAVARRVRLERHVLEVLGADPEDHVSPLVGAQGGPYLKGGLVEREVLLADVHRKPSIRARHRRLDHVHGGRADEAADEQVDGPVVQGLRVGHLLQLALPHDGYAVSHRHRLDLVVRHIDGRRPEAALKAAHFAAHLDAQLRVEVRERLVHEEDRRLAHDRPAHRDALALAAGERARLALEERLKPESLGRVADPPVDLLLRHLLDTEAEGDVVVDREVWIERVALKDHRDVAVPRGDVVDDPVPDPDCSAGDVLEPGDHSQGGRLAAARRPHQNHELPVGDVERQRVDGLRAVGVHLRHFVEDDLCHVPPGAS